MNLPSRFGRKAILFFLFGSCVAASSNPKKDQVFIDLWTRLPGQYAENGGPDPGHLEKIDVASLKQVVSELVDVQYHRKNTYQGVWLKDLIASYKPSRPSDLAILHFTNGMVIPLPLHSSKIINNIPVFVALKVKVGKEWASNFEKVVRSDFAYKTPLPTNFQGNKIVVQTKRLPSLPNQAPGSDDFSPWLHVDSLTSIEFVDSQSYYHQFDFSQDSDVAAGKKVFEARCQYCHGAWQIGASFGWDYVKPLPIHEKRKPEDLYYHVKYPKAKNHYFSTRMPNQKSFSLVEATNLWEWLKAASENKPKAYK